MKTASAIFRSMRPRQWTKNLLVFAALIFSDNALNAAYITRALAAFALFCLVSGAVYIFNDLRDVENDRLHEKKRLRPLASGQLSSGTAVAAMASFGMVALTCSALLGLDFLGIVAAYLVVQVAYTLGVKRYAILDVMTIAAGFVLRAAGGGVAIHVPVSTWLLVCTALLALFLSLGKRRHELLLLEDTAPDHRVSLHGYSTELIDQMMSSVTAMTVMSYTLYTFFPGNGSRHGVLLLTVPFVVYGLFRYLNLVYMHRLGGDPEEILLTDQPLIIDIVLFVLVAAVAIYIR